jgi:hypothetical protein
MLIVRIKVKLNQHTWLERCLTLSQPSGAMSKCADKNIFFNSISTVGHQLFGLSLISYTRHISGLFYKPMMIVSDDSRVVNKLEASLTDDARVTCL